MNKTEIEQLEEALEQIRHILTLTEVKFPWTTVIAVSEAFLKDMQEGRVMVPRDATDEMVDGMFKGLAEGHHAGVKAAIAAAPKSHLDKCMEDME